ncbi:type II toxin-antitoxin system HicB family antitoxin [Treponema sp.]|uniref:type II toxin-antitoxin system HicB family antitoxin n=1 Tax=Treponema sp. TaxID=166 RepID=UPI003FA26971
MKTVEEYMKLPYKLEIIPDTDEPGFIASYPELPGCITCAENISQAVLNAEDAKREWLCTALENGTEIKLPQNIQAYSRQFKMHSR